MVVSILVAQLHSQPVGPKPPAQIGSMMSTRRCAMGNFVKVATTGVIAPGEGKLVDAGGKKIALFNVDGTFYAIDETCTHRGGPLSEGMLMGTKLTCPVDRSSFDG